jgi:hypothetical protein
MHHTQVTVAPSAISGRGLFAKGDIRAGTVIADYTVGTQALSAHQFATKYPTGRATHVWRHPRGVYFDAVDASKSIAGMANRAPRGGRNNSRITGGGKLMTTRAVPEGREITAAYGAAFRV